MLLRALVTYLFVRVVQAGSWHTSKVVTHDRSEMNHHRSEMLQSVDSLGGKLANLLVSRAQKSWIPKQATLDNATLAKSQLKTSYAAGTSRIPMVRSSFLASHHLPIAHSQRVLQHFHPATLQTQTGHAVSNFPIVGVRTVPLPATLESDSSPHTHSNHNHIEEISAAEFLKITQDPTHEPLIVDWEAKWCRKCKFLRPKLAQLKEAFPKLRFVSVDVQQAPLAVVQGAGVSKMPTVQVWKNGQNIREVIGGEGGKMVITQIRNMVRESTTEHERGEDQA
jgi:thiol-disulfide isomerase/thioredoxin